MLVRALRLEHMAEWDLGWLVHRVRVRALGMGPAQIAWVLARPPAGAVFGVVQTISYLSTTQNVVSPCVVDHRYMPHQSY